jgi:lysophospholipase L1-like esterase
VNSRSPVDLLTKSLVKVSCFGDSITNGYGITPTRYQFVNKLNELLGRDSAFTTTTGSNLFVAASASVSSGAVLSGTEFTLTASAGDTLPRFAMVVDTTPTGKFYLMTAKINTTGIAGKQATLRYAAGTSSPNIIPTAEFLVPGLTEDTGSGVYKTVYFVISGDYILSLDATAAQLYAGGEITPLSAAASTAKIKDVTVHELTAGIAVHNQGVDGNDAAAGIARIATVTAWSPDLCLVAFGTNDIRAGTTLATFLTNLTQICITLTEAGVYPVLATLPPLDTDQTNYSLVPLWNEAIRSLAEQLHVGLWDRYLALRNGNIAYISDGQHPTQNGYHLLALTAREVLIGRASL